jgi:osmotically-inducible protein OsmY
MPIMTDKQRRARRLILLSFLILIVLLSLYTPIFAEEIKDKDIALAVDQALMNDQSVSPRLIDIQVDEAIVTLSGSVDNLLARERAAEIAQTIKGVRSVVNKLTVRPVVRDDEQILSDAKKALFNDPATDSYEIKVRVEKGTVTLTGTVDSWQAEQLCLKVVKGIKGVREVISEVKVEPKVDREDSEVEAEIKRRLHWDVWLDDALIDVNVKNGKVLLSGVVGSAAERERACGDARVSGVVSVDDSDLKVDWLRRDEMRRGQKYEDKSDKEVEKAVKDAFLYDPRVLSFKPEVEVKDGIVTLTGVVDNLKAKKAAEDDALNTVGVWRVRNYLKVRPLKQLNDSIIAKRVWDALSKDPFLDQHRISVSVLQGKVYLKGTVNYSFEKSRAEDITSSIQGVVEIENNLRINDTLLDEEVKSDWEIKMDIETELSWDPFVDKDEVTVTVQGGVATLSGIVDGWTQRAAATADAYQGGAVKVINHLKVLYGPAYYRP